MVKTKKAVKSSRKTKKISKRGGVHCENQDSMSFFTWTGNSCYLDSLLIGWLHYAGPDFIQSINALKNAEGNQNKKNLLTYIIDIVDALSLFPQNPVADPIKKITKIRNEFRKNLQACPNITDMFGRLTDIQDPAHIFNALTHMLNINDVIIQNKYVPFIGYSPENIARLQAENPERREFDTLEEGLARFGNNPHPERADTLTYTNMITLPIYVIQSPSEIVNTQLPFQRNNNEYWYSNERHYVGTVNGILPINIERLNQDGSVSDNLVNLETEIGMDDGNYELVSIICYVPGHYVGYYKCHDTDEWIFYNDLGVSKKGGGKCKDEINQIKNEYITNIDDLFTKGITLDISTYDTIKISFENFRKARLEYKIYSKLCKYISKGNNIKEFIQQTVIDEKEIDIEYLKKLRKIKDNNLVKWYQGFRKSLVDNIDKLFKFIIKKTCTTESTNNNNVNNNNLNNNNVNNNPNLYIRVGNIDTWKDKPIHGYERTPEQSATLLFYHKIE
jgi:hypothetical protein